MTILRLKDYVKGWFIGDFFPSIIQTKNFEVGVKTYKQGDKEEPHYHKVATEITVINYGKAIMDGRLVSEGDIIVIDSKMVTGFEALTNCQTTVVKVPSVKGDKYIA